MVTPRDIVTITWADGTEFVLDTAPVFLAGADPGPVSPDGYCRGFTSYTAQFRDVHVISHRIIWRRRLRWWLTAPWRWLRRACGKARKGD